MPDAGWYEDQTDATRLRYWDGTAWTEHTSPVAPPAPPQPPVAPPQPTPPAFAPPGQSTPTAPPTFAPPGQSFSPPPPQSFTPPSSGFGAQPGAQPGAPVEGMPAGPASYTVSKKSSKKPLAIALVVLLLVGGGAGAWFATRDTGFTVDDAKAVFSRHGATCTRGKAATVGELMTKFGGTSDVGFANDLRNKMKKEVADLPSATELTAWSCEAKGDPAKAIQATGSLVTWNDDGTDRPLFALMLSGNTLTKELKAVDTDVLVLDLGFDSGFNGKNAVTDCKTERAVIITAFAAAKASSQAGNPQEFQDFLTPGKVFDYYDTPTAEGAARINTDTVSEDDCAALTASDLN